MPDTSEERAGERLEFEGTYEQTALLVLGFPIIWLVLAVVAVASGEWADLSGWQLAAFYLLPPAGSVAFGLRRWLDPRPRLVVDSEGILDRTDLFGREEFIPWEQVAEVEERRRDFLRIRLEDPASVADQLPPPLGMIRKLSIRARIPAVRINLSLLRADRDRIVAGILAMQEQHLLEEFRKERDEMELPPAED